jgi:hypothetical protein
LKDSLKEMKELSIIVFCKQLARGKRITSKANSFLVLLASLR